MTKITDQNIVPKFDYDVKWKQNEERTQRKKLVPYQPDSNRMDDEESNTNLTRQRSKTASEKGGENKKQKLNEDSLSSDDTDEDI